MTRTVINDYHSYTNTALSLAAGDSLFVTSNGVMDGQTGLVPLISATSAFVQNDGLISSNYDGVYLVSSTLVNHGVIESTSSNSFAVWMQPNGSSTTQSLLVNTGLIANYSTNGQAIAVVNSFTSKITNDGTIGNYGGGVAIFNYANLTLQNNGQITALQGGVAIDGSGGSANTIDNHGQISGAVFLASNVDVLTNDGKIVGVVDLDSGNDTLTNTYGVITGNIIGGLGNDTINGGVQRDVIYGDDLASTDTSGGTDSLFGFYGDDVIYGGFGNDTIQGNQGNDVLYGDAGNDFLHGGQDSDQLYGGDGNDILNGGLGADVLTGGAGDDRFVYALNFGRDTIADFSAVSGNNDTIQFQAGTFANYADVQNHMVQQGNNVVIELNVNDSVVLLNTTTAALTSDHFIFG